MTTSFPRIFSDLGVNFKKLFCCWCGFTSAEVSMVRVNILRLLDLSISLNLNIHLNFVYHPLLPPWHAWCILTFYMVYFKDTSLLNVEIRWQLTAVGIAYAGSGGTKGVGAKTSESLCLYVFLLTKFVIFCTIST